MKNSTYLKGIPLALLFYTGLTFAAEGPKATQAGLDAEASERIAGDATLQAGLDAEAAERIAGDATLQQAIDTIELTPGPQGPSGVTNAYSVMGDQTFLDPEEQRLISVFCDEGDFPSGGGIFQWQAGQELDGIQILESTATGMWDYQELDPSSADNLPSGGWQVRVKHSGDGPTIVSATVQCLTLN